ncbi:hypothetical protein OSTOST_00749, partial [Ostertagia ostertagi]
MHPQIFFIIVHQSVVMTLAILGNLFLIFVIFRGNHAVRRRISPVQLLLLHTCAADLLFALVTLGTEILTLNYSKSFYLQTSLLELIPAFISALRRLGLVMQSYALWTSATTLCQPILVGGHQRRSLSGIHLLKMISKMDQRVGPLCSHADAQNLMSSYMRTGQIITDLSQLFTLFDDAQHRAA